MCSNSNELLDVRKEFNKFEDEVFDCNIYEEVFVDGKLKVLYYSDLKKCSVREKNICYLNHKKPCQCMDKENGFILPNIIKCEDCGRDIIQCAMIINIYETQINPLCSDCLKISQKKIREREIELDRFKRFKGKKKFEDFGKIFYDDYRCPVCNDGVIFYDHSSGMGVCHRDYCGKKFINMTPDNLYVRDFPVFFYETQTIPNCKTIETQNQIKERINKRKEQIKQYIRNLPEIIDLNNF